MKNIGSTIMDILAFLVILLGIIQIIKEFIIGNIFENSIGIIIFAIILFIILIAGAIGMIIVILNDFKDIKK